MIIGSVMLLGLFVFPMWNIRLGAPQYPEPLGIDIYVNGLQGESEFDIQNIDGLNHYIGMKTLPKPEEMWEFSVFPKVVMAMASSGGIDRAAGLPWRNKTDMVSHLVSHYERVGSPWYLRFQPVAGGIRYGPGSQCDLKTGQSGWNTHAIQSTAHWT